VHTNYYFLKQVSAALTSRLVGTVISESFSQNKDELVIRFETSSVPFFIRASLEPGFCCVTFPKEFNRARKNSVDLFEPIIGRRVLGVRQFSNERSFALLLQDEVTLLFKMHGNRANLVLMQNDAVIDLFKNTMVADREIALGALDRVIDFSREAFEAHLDKLPGLYFTLGKLPWQYLQTLGFDSKTVDEKWALVQGLFAALEQPSYYVVNTGTALALSLVETGRVLHKLDDPLEASNIFFQRYTESYAFHQGLNRLRADLAQRIKSGRSYLQKTEQKLGELETEHPYKIWADLIMANLHAITQGATTATLADFTTQEPVTIKLKPDLNAQKNAAIFYKKAKNQHIEAEHLTNAIAEKKAELDDLEQQLDTLATVHDLKALRALTKDNPAPVDKKQQLALPYFEHTFGNYRIWVGKDAQRNDELTLKYGYKEDLWLHAKDVAGSHVIIKHQSGKHFPKDVIERAAQLAAYHSKRKTDTLCPVIVTPKKYVRKRKGDPAGLVVVEREDVIMVEPRG
jgi:predicted ribosome quality control (RQC) complex YloA/Tae2 family protein